MVGDGIAEIVKQESRKGQGQDKDGEQDTATTSLLDRLDN
jgi:hypothetical protein